MMRDLRAAYWVWRRELHEMLRAPLVYGIGGVFLFVQGVAFAGLVGSLSDPQRAAPLGALIEGQLAGTLLTWVLQLVVLTLLGMRAIADDKRSGAWELLLTAQVGEGAAVIGKWLAASTMYALLWVPTLAYYALVAAFRADGGGWDVATIACGYAGAIAVGTALLAWAVAASAATQSTLAAGGLGFALLVAMFLVGELTTLWPELPVDHPRLAAVFEALSIRGAVLGLARGEIGASSLVLVAGLAVTGLSLAIALACGGRRRRREVRTRLGGTVGIAAICVVLGAFAARHPLRVDVSDAGRNTLDPSTFDVLAGLQGPTELTIVLPTLGGLEPIYDEIVRVAERMSEHADIEVRVVDPVNAPGGLDAIAKVAGVARADLARGGSVVVDHRGGRRVLDLLSLATIERGPGDAPKIERLAIEQAVAGALAALSRARGIVACATTSHGELPIVRAPNATDDNDWHLVGDRLRAHGIAIEETTLEHGVEERCHVLIVAGPAVPLTAREALAVQDHLRAGRGLLVAAASRTLPKAATGLEGVLAAEGLGLPAAVAIDPTLTVREVPGALLVVDGYTEHPINRGFARARGTLWFQPRAVVAMNGARPLVSATAASWGERDFVAPPAKQADDLGGPIALAAIGKGTTARTLALGSAESFTSSLLAGGGIANDLWLARAVRWLANAGDPDPDIAARTPSQVRLVLTQGQRSTIVTLSVAGIPLAWLVLGGGFVMWRHRRGRRREETA
jgi:ABC-2 type transport system permease protein